MLISSPYFLCVNLLLVMFATSLFSQEIGLFSQEEEKQNETTQIGQSEEEVDSRIVEMINVGASQLIKLQEDDHAWPYEGVYRVRREIPVGYRVGGTAIVCRALLSKLISDREGADQAITKGIELILNELEDPLMVPSVDDRYDVRVWGHIYALDLFCCLRNHPRFESLIEKTDVWIPMLVDALSFEEIKNGGWNYANQRSHACFVTAPCLQALMLARDAGFEVDDELFANGAQALIDSRNELGTFRYSGRGAKAGEPIEGSIARSAICEATLIKLGKGDAEKLAAAIVAFHEHWDELEKRRKKTGTHEPPFGIAPYYFYYGHRYVAQALLFLPKEKRQAETRKFQDVLLKTKDGDGTWNDRVFDRSKAYGTAMATLALDPTDPFVELNITKPKQLQ